MCAKDRPGHFHGVALIVSKLLKIIKPDYIYLGEKDYQQTIVIKELIAKLSMKTKIKTHQIVREENGLALSSRNSRLNHENKLIAVEIFKVLNAINNEIQENFFLLSRLEYFKEFLINVGFEKVNYLEIRKDDNLSLVYGNINYINKNNKILRQWNSNKFSKNLIKNGWMPPHPSMFVKKIIYDSVGGYDTKYKISSDYDFILKVFFNEKIKSLFNDMFFVHMEVGGISNRNIKSIIRKLFEDLRILISHSKNPIFITRALIFKNLLKIKQFFF